MIAQADRLASYAPPLEQLSRTSVVWSTQVLLLLVEKGRLGDTYPKSFCCLDLRARNRTGLPYVAPMVQELGRLCGYYTACDSCKAPDAPCDECAAKRPHVVVSPKLFDAVDKASQHKDKTLGLLVEHPKHLDDTMKPKTETADLQTSDDMAGLLMSLRKCYSAIDGPDKGRREKAERDHAKQFHERRILFCGKPQVGKTSSFFALIEVCHISRSHAQPLPCARCPPLLSDPPRYLS